MGNTLSLVRLRSGSPAPNARFLRLVQRAFVGSRRNAFFAARPLAPAVVDRARVREMLYADSAPPAFLAAARLDQAYVETGASSGTLQVFFVASKVCYLSFLSINKRFPSPWIIDLTKDCKLIG